MNLVYHRIKELFEQKGVEYTEYRHRAAYTSGQAAAARRVELKTGVKALVCKTDSGNFILVLVRADRKADLGKMAALENTAKIKLASPEEVHRITGCKPGSVPPFGHKLPGLKSSGHLPLKTYFDRSILENEWVNFNIGLRTRSASIRAGDLEKLIDGAIIFG